MGRRTAPPAAQLIDVSLHREISNKVARAIQATGLNFQGHGLKTVVTGTVTKPPGFVDASGSGIDTIEVRWEMPARITIISPAEEAAFIQRVLSQIPFLQHSAISEAPSNGENGHEKGKKGFRVVHD